MTNAEKFKQLFGIYATELWAMPEESFLEWLNAETGQDWIPVTERLPEDDDYRPCYGYDDGAVWWLNDIGMMGLGWYYTSTENWAFYDEITHVEGIVGNVIAWRPLPESFREEEV